MCILSSHTHTSTLYITHRPHHTHSTRDTHTIDGSVDLNALLDQLNQSSQTEVTVKSEILHTVLGIFQLDSSKKSAFREVSGFYYLISVLASLIGGLSPRRFNPWLEGTYMYMQCTEFLVLWVAQWSLLIYGHLHYGQVVLGLKVLCVCMAKPIHAAQYMYVCAL